MGWTERVSVTVAAAGLPLAIYLVWRLRRTAGALFPRLDRPAISLLRALAAWWVLYPVLLIGSALLDRRIGSGPWWNLIIVYPFWAGTVWIAQLAPYLLMLDVLGLPIRLLPDPVQQKWASARPRIAMFVAVMVTLYTLPTVFLNSARVRVRTETVKVPDLPAALSGLRIGHIADLQADAITDRTRMQRYVDAVNGLDANLLLFSGDLIVRGTEYIELGAEMMGEMEASQARLACLGDHDIWSDEVRIADRLKEEGIEIYDDRHRRLELEGGTVVVSVVTNTYSARPDLNATALDPPDADVKILLTHQPTKPLVDWAAERGYHLMAAGHTHGGQVVMNWWGSPVSPVLAETPYLAGLFQVGSMVLSINNGLGFTAAPIRYNAPAEVTLLTLERL